MNVLINAYACSPIWGSEPGMGWNWVSNLARFCNLYIITEGEWMNEIEKTVSLHSFKDHLHFYYLPVSDKVRKMCWNQGDWRFYYHYRKWQKRAYKKAKEIINEEQIDIIHHLNMVCFREPGYLWKLDKPFIWGPIGGMGVINPAFIKDAPLSVLLKSKVKYLISDIQLHYMHRVDCACDKASVIISAVPVAQKKLRAIKKRDSIMISETGCYELNLSVDDKKSRKEFHILWVGRFIFTKRLDIALKTITRIKNLPNLKFHIVGGGTEFQEQKYHQLCSELGIDHICEWHGVIKNDEVHKLMRMSDVFLFTSVAEATSTVVPEAINNNLPVVCHDTCGFGPIINERIGRKIEMVNPEESISKFAEILRNLYLHRDVLYKMSINCHEAMIPLLWENKAERVFELYHKVLINNP